MDEFNDAHPFFPLLRTSDIILDKRVHPRFNRAETGWLPDLACALAQQ
jgi:hypothetical protein